MPLVFWTVVLEDVDVRKRMKKSNQSEKQRLKVGVQGLDDILNGGLIPNRIYLVEGDPGSGKTTLSLQFLLEGYD